jgi:ABC-type transport system involved in multi-copper enzyme maturation permease subunit
MNWKNVLSLMQVDRKSGRLIRGRKLTKYRENKFFAYWAYWVALAVGLAVGILACVVYNYASAADHALLELFQAGTLSLFLSLPTLVLIYSLVFTMMQQIQRSGVKSSSQVPYWLPITWQEHALASILANLLGFPLASIVFIGSAIIIFSIVIGQILAAVLTVLAVCAAAFMASATTEVFRIVQMRFIGAVYKSSGRAAVWVRFVGSLLFFILFYVGYFYVTSGAGAVTFIETVASAQSTVWFIPFVWLGMTLFYFTSGLLLQGLAFLALSLCFIAGLFFLAVALNRRFGLYEPPAITVSRGVYLPRTGFLGKLGFSTVEAALIRKDFRAFTRRRELMTIFIAPIVMILVPLMQSLSQTNAAVPYQVSVYLAAITFLFPASVIVISLGSFIIGEEGQAVWRVYSSPVSAKNLVKSKYFFIIFFSLIVLAITGIFGFLVYHPSLRATIVASFETVFLGFTLGAISLSNGIKGADFTEIPRPRMIRLSWSLINLGVCLLAGTAMLAPFLPYVLSTALSAFIPISIGWSALLDPFQALVVSAIIAIILTVIFYRVALKNAKDLLAKAEV